MRIVLVRHGEAVPFAADDASRALTSKGLQQARASGAWLRRELGSVTGAKLLASPYRRARETAGVIAGVLELPVHALEAITPDGDPRVALAAIEQAGDGAEVWVVISHMPLVAALAAWLEAGVLAAGRGFSLGEARIFEADLPGPGLATPRSVYIPGLSNGQIFRG